MYFWVNIFSQLKNDRPLLWSRRNLDGPCALETVHLRLYTKTDYPKRLKVDGPKGENRTVFWSETRRSLVEVDGPKALLSFSSKDRTVFAVGTVHFRISWPSNLSFFDRPAWHMTVQFHNFGPSTLTQDRSIWPKTVHFNLWKSF